ncbi:Sua5/YciO/YrdC/YwlC family protein [Methylobacter sp. YRD-M1]|uniref:Sua5/YciO/YrdC/YwlC family protein n=1 Tax=Methylobacter sp. YRD-M1 TaxID=2911520 RepID=UPI00227D5B90|nr:Sua5/YciO/YrdC/YwlC family protein [Methylobacter sp. YRD-M1]WAK01681.1 Sua5/YciO/YrdC/YwlC family protein [Methylobacter sp. YRD-M1]
MAYYSNFKIRNAVRHIKAGEVIAYPTEAVYGLGCDPLNEDAVLSLLDIKLRPVDKGLILIASSLQQLQPYLILNQAMIGRITPTWPGPVTWVIPAQPWVPVWLTGAHESLAVRVTDHPVARRLCACYGGPIVSTSANASTRPAIRQARKLVQAFSGSGVFLLHGPTGGLKQETAIYDAVSGNRLR